MGDAKDKLKYHKAALVNLMGILHELKHKGKLPDALETAYWRGFIECFNPEKV